VGFFFSAHVADLYCWIEYGHLCSLLEQKLSIFEHFRGTGRTMDEIVDPQGFSKMSGVFEFVVPNSKLSALAEVAIINRNYSRG